MSPSAMDQSIAKVDSRIVENAARYFVWVLALDAVVQAGAAILTHTADVLLFVYGYAITAPALLVGLAPFAIATLVVEGYVIRGGRPISRGLGMAISAAVGLAYLVGITFVAIVAGGGLSSQSGPAFLVNSVVALGVGSSFGAIQALPEKA
jgi:hypothetical protein